MAQIIQFRRDYSSNWTLANPVLAQGELGVEFDNYNVKIGNGISSWNQLPYGLGTASALGADWATSTITGTNLLISTGNTNTIYYPSYITTAALSNHTHDYASSNHDHSQYLTTAAQSDHTHSQYVNTSLTSQWLTTAMASQNTSLFLYTSNSSLFDLTANNSLSLGTSYTSHTHNYQPAGAYLTTAALSNHTHSQYQSTGNYLTTAALSDHTHNYAGTGTSATNASITLNTNGLAISVAAGGDTLNAMNTSERGNYFYTSNNTFLTTAALSNHTHSNLYVNTSASSLLQHTSATSAITASAINTSASGSFQLTSDNSLSLGTGYTTHTHLYQSTGNYLTTAMQSNMTSVFQYTSNTSNITSNAINTSQSSLFEYTSATSNITASAMNTSERGRYFYTSNNTFANSTHTHGGLTLNVTNLSTSITSASNGLTINISAANPSAAGGNVPNRSICEIIPGEYLTRVINISATQVSNKILFNPFWLDGQGLIASTVRFIMSWVTNTTPPVFTYGAALYKMNNSTQATLYDSTTATVNYATSQSASYSGIRVWDVTGMTKSLDEGRYILGLYFSYGATSNANASLYGASNWPAIAGYISGDSGTATTNNTLHLFPFQGRYSTTTNGFPNTVNIGDIYGGRSQDAFDYYAILKQV